MRDIRWDVTKPLGAAILVLLACAAGGFSTPAGAAELLMFEQKACPFCEAFNREIAPDYRKSRAGRQAPLRHVDI